MVMQRQRDRQHGNTNDGGRDIEFCKYHEDNKQRKNMFLSLMLLT